MLKTEQWRAGFITCVLLGILLFLPLTPVAAVVEYATHNTSCNNGTQIATIGTIITYDLWIRHDSGVSAPPSAFVQLWDNGPNRTMNLVSQGPIIADRRLASYTYSYTVVDPLLDPTMAANGLNAPRQFEAFNTSSTMPVHVVAAPQSRVVIDNVRPKTLGAPAVSINRNDGTGYAPWNGADAILQNNSIRIEQVMDPNTFQTVPTTEVAWLNATTLGLGTFTANTDTGNRRHTFNNIVPPDNLDGDYTFLFRADDPYGNRLVVNPFVTLHVDTRPPVIRSALMSASRSPAKAGDVVHISVGINIYDNDTVTASCAAITPATINLTRVGNTSTFTADISVLPSPARPPFVGNFSAEITVRDDDGNIATISTNEISIDNRRPEFDSSPRAVLTELIPKTNDGIGIINDRLIFLATVTAELGQNIEVIADLTPLGVPGLTNLNLSGVGAGLYSLDYYIQQGTAEDNSPKSFQITATDLNAGGNTVASWTTPPIPIDNVPPVFVGAPTLTRVSGVGPHYIIGDQFKITATIGNLSGAELGAVSVNIASLSLLYPGLTALTRDAADQTLFEGTFTVGSFSVQGMGWDAMQNLRIIASDAQGNIASATLSTGEVIDNEFPLATASYATSTASPFVLAGDSVTFILEVNSRHLDLNDPTIDLTGLGSGSAEFMSWSSARNRYELKFVIGRGDMDRINQPFTITLTDDHGNNGQFVVRIPIDNQPPVIDNLTAISNNAQPTKVLYRNTIGFSVNCSGITNLNGSVSVDLSRFGHNQVTPLTYAGSEIWTGSFLATHSWNVPIVDTNGAATWFFTVTASDTSGNLAVATTSLFIVDNEPPLLFDPVGMTYESATYTATRVGINLTPGVPWVRIGDNLTVRVRLASPSHDGEVSQVDLSTLGLGANTPMPFRGLWYESTLQQIATMTVLDGLNFGATFPIDVRDNDGNELHVYDGSEWVPFNASASVPLDNIPPQTSEPLVVTGIRIDNTYDPQGYEQQYDPTFVINLNRNLTFTWPHTDADGGSCTIDLSLIGSSTVASMVWQPGLYTTTLQTASDGVTQALTNYPFRVVMTDKAGNVIATTSQTLHSVDCVPPTILEASVTAANPVVSIGTALTFRARIQTLDYVSANPEPLLDLRRIGGGQFEQMIFNPYSNLFELIFPVKQAVDGQAGFNGEPPEFALLVFDSVRNLASMTVATTTFLIKNTPVQTIGNVDLINLDSMASATSPIAIGQNLRLKLQIAPAEVVQVITSSGTADLSAVGFSANEQLSWDGVNAFYIDFTTATTTAEYSNYIFSMRITDKANQTWVFDTRPNIFQVDCQPPTILTPENFILETNGDNPVAWVANQNDIIAVTASFALPIDFTAVVTLSSGGAMLGNANMHYDESLRRHLATFTIPAPVGPWALNLATLSFLITAVDDAGNHAIPAAGDCNFAVDNVPPVLTQTNWTIDPDIPNVNVINIGSGTTIDRLRIQAAFDAAVHEAWLDLSDYPGAPEKYPLSISGNTASNPVGINFSSYSLTDIGPRTFHLWSRDFGGNTVTANTTMLVDMARPAVSSAEFDGHVLKAVFAPDKIYNVATSGWQIVGSSTSGVMTTLTFDDDDTLIVDQLTQDSFEVHLSFDHRKELATWASTTLYLRPLLNLPFPPLTNVSGNWVQADEMLPITLTSSTWREDPALIDANIVHDWPGNSFVLRLTFSKPIIAWDASGAMLLSDPEPAWTTAVDYEYRYVLQPGADTFAIEAGNILRIDLDEQAARWLVSRIGSGNKTVKLATRPGMTLVRDEFSNAMKPISALDPFEISVTRPAEGAFKVVPGVAETVLDLSSGLLKLTVNEHLVNCLPRFDTLSIDPPTMGPATRTAFVTSAFRNRMLEFHYKAPAPNGSYTSLILQPLDQQRNPDVSSNSVLLGLTDDDITRILQLVRDYPDILNGNWGLRVHAGALHNWWGQANEAFDVSGPGNLTVIIPTTATASVAAVGVSDPPPTKGYAPGLFHWEIEFLPVMMGANAVPLASTTPKSRLSLLSDGRRIASGSFVGWHTRQVAGEPCVRYVAEFVNSETFADAAHEAAQIEFFDVVDVFDNRFGGTASFVFDLGARNDAVPGGYSTASAVFVIDTQAPTMVSVAPFPYILRADPGLGSFSVIFSEPMDTSPAWRPNLELATDGMTLGFSFDGWLANDMVAHFRNDLAITEFTPNGTWTYRVAGGRDAAGNPFVGPVLQDVQVITELPPVVEGILITTQPIATITPFFCPPADIAFSPFVGETSPGAGDARATLQVNYSAASVKYLPHSVCFYDQHQVEVGSAPLAFIDAYNAQATFTAADLGMALPPPLQGPTSFTVRVGDAVGNRTEMLPVTVVYDGVPPNLASFSLSNIATFSAGVYYTNTALHGVVVAHVETSVSTDPLRLTLTEENTLGTGTLAMIQSAAKVYDMAIDAGLAPGTWSLSLIDWAGNPTASPPLRLINDTQRPWVVAVTPVNTVIGPTSAGNLVISVTFSEPMDPDPLKAPTVFLATTGVQLPTSFLGWENPAIATIAYYYNAEDIVDPPVLPASYSYLVSGGCDWVGNTLFPTSIGEFVLGIHTRAYTPVTTMTAQQHPLFGVTNTQPMFSPLVAPFAASFTFNYGAAPRFTPHDVLVYTETDDFIGQLTSFVPTTAVATVSPTTAEWQFLLGGVGGPASFGIRLRDSLGNVSPYPLFMFVYDEVSPALSAIDFYDDQRGIASAGIRYFAPLQGLASVSWTTTSSDSQRLVLASGTATHTTSLTEYHAEVGADYLFETITGAAWPEGLYSLSVADAAGNPAIGAVPAIQVQVDRTAPNVIGVAPVTIIGSHAIGAAQFQITFDEPMNPNHPITPTILLEGGMPVVRIPLQVIAATPATWTLTNVEAITATHPQGLYYYVIEDAHDYAGNPNVEPPPASWTLEVRTQGPNYVAELISYQHLITGLTPLTDQPFSIDPAVEPAEGELRVSYNQGPFAKPHSVHVYDADEMEVASIALMLTGPTNAVAVVDADFFGAPAAIAFGPATFSIRVRDVLGNFSPAPFQTIVYDSLPPTITEFSVAGVSDATDGEPFFYNEQVQGDLTANLTAVTTDTLRLLLTSGTATHTFVMTDDGSGNYSRRIPANVTAELPEGPWQLTAVDLAGNFAVGASAVVQLVIDRTAPLVVDVAMTPIPPLHCLPAGGATFTVDFNEPLNQVSATPTLWLATGSHTIPCTFTAWLDPQTVEFRSIGAIEASAPQGLWEIHVTAEDLARNRVATIAATVMVVSRGPVVETFQSRSFQATTASSVAEILFDQPFSFAVPPQAATLSFRLTQPPTALPVYLHFQDGEQTVASYVVPVPGNAGSFTWSPLSGPLPVAPTTYRMRLFDGFGNPSLESHLWRMDASAPVVMQPIISGGVPATAAVYFNPALHNVLEVSFAANETQPPRLRVRGAISTDTYSMVQTGSNLWSGVYDGRFSRGAEPRVKAPNGVYLFDLVDAAGNVGLLSSGAAAVATAVIDASAPIVTDFVALHNAQPVTRFSPLAGPIEIVPTTADPLTETGIWWIEIRNDSNVFVRRVPLTPDGAGIHAFWDGQDAVGNMVLDGTYRFYATDFARNRTANFISLQVLTSPFILAGAEQFSASMVDLVFNGSVAPDSVADAVVQMPPLAIVSKQLVAPNRLRIMLSEQMQHGMNYTITVVPGTLYNDHGVTIAAPDNQAALVADVQGPIPIAVDYDGIVGQRTFRIVFDEVVTLPTAEEGDRYRLLGPAGQVTVANVSLHGDQTSVILITNTDLLENQAYNIAVAGVEDVFGNPSSPEIASCSFIGRDITPPVFVVGAFSNPSNEYDLIAVVAANEAIAGVPILRVAQSGADPFDAPLISGSRTNTWMAGIRLKEAFPGNGRLTVTGSDLAGNEGRGVADFTIAHVSASVRVSLDSSDNQLNLLFPQGCCRNDMIVKILPQVLHIDQSEVGRAALLPALSTTLQSFRVPRLSSRKISPMRASVAENAELVPVGLGYEVSFPAANLIGPMGVTLLSPVPTAPLVQTMKTAQTAQPAQIAQFEQVSRTTLETGTGQSTNARTMTEQGGIGMFLYAEETGWTFLRAVDAGADKIRIGARQPGIYALLRDVMPPRVSLHEEIDLSDPFYTGQPVLAGKVIEDGAGLEAGSLCGSIDNGPTQPITVGADGNFVFTPAHKLSGGFHEVVFSARDRTGNVGYSARYQIQVVVPLEIGQIMHFPNPARTRTQIRIAANRRDLDDDAIEVKIYDVAGHRVRTLSGVRPVHEQTGAVDRYLYDIPWDLTNERGQRVANGVYLARVTVRDPDDSSKKTRKNHKIAVLR